MEIQTVLLSIIETAQQTLLKTLRAYNIIIVDGISVTHGQSPRKHIWTIAVVGIKFRLKTTMANAQHQSLLAITTPAHQEIQVPEYISV